MLLDKTFRNVWKQEYPNLIVGEDDDHDGDDDGDDGDGNNNEKELRGRQIIKHLHKDNTKKRTTNSKND